MLNKIFATDFSAGWPVQPALLVHRPRYKQAIMGNPDPDLMNTSFAERQDNAHVDAALHPPGPMRSGKKFENHCHALALYLCSITSAASTRRLAQTPAMAAGLVDKVLKMADVVGMIDARETPASSRSLQEAEAEISN